MWFKQIQFYQLKSKHHYDPEALSADFSVYAHTPCPPGTSMSVGWVPPIASAEFQEAPLVLGANGYMIFCLKIEEKLLPATVVKEYLDEKIKALEAQSGRPVYKKEKQRLKEELSQQLLSQAFSKSKRVHAYFDTLRGHLVINSAQPKVIDMMLDLLRKSIQGLQLAKLDLVDLPTVLTGWLNQTHLPNDFTLEDNCVLRDPADQNRKVRCQRQDLAADGVQAFLKEGQQVQELRLSWKEQLLFTLRHDFTLAQVQYGEDVLALAGESDDESDLQAFLSNFSIMSETLAGFFPELLEQFVRNSKAQEEKQESLAEA